MQLQLLLQAPETELHVAVDHIQARLASLDELLDLERISSAARVQLTNEYQQLSAHVNQLRHDTLITAASDAVVTAGALVFLLWTRVRLVLHDAAWCEEDECLRRNPHQLKDTLLFNEHQWAQTPYTYLNKHPRYEYTKAELRSAFMALLISPTLTDPNFTAELHGYMVDRVCVLLHYTVSSDNDVDEYADCSAFLHDCYHLVTNIQRKLDTHRRFDVAPNARFDQVLREATPVRTAWLNGMVLTAAGDDLASVFNERYLNWSVEHAERRIHERSHGRGGSSYNVLVETRGRDAADTLSRVADNFIADLIRYETEEDLDAAEYAERAAAVVAERCAALEPRDRNVLHGVLFEYTVKRLLGLNFFGHVVTDTSDARFPTLREVCYTTKFAMVDASGDTVGVFSSVADAFTVWLWWVMYYHDGSVYHPDTHAEVDIRSYAKQVLWDIKE